MYDAISGCHPIYLAGLDLDFAAKAVFVHDAAFEQIRQRRQANVRMRRHIKIFIIVQRDRAHVVDESKRPNHTFVFEREQSAHHKIPDNIRAFLNNQFDI